MTVAAPPWAHRPPAWGRRGAERLARPRRFPLSGTSRPWAAAKWCIIGPEVCYGTQVLGTNHRAGDRHPAVRPEPAGGVGGRRRQGDAGIQGRHEAGRAQSTVTFGRGRSERKRRHQGVTSAARAGLFDGERERGTAPVLSSAGRGGRPGSAPAVPWRGPSGAV